MAKDVTVHFSGDVDSRVVRVDNKVLTFNGETAVASDVAPGKHFLQWFGEAVPGTEYQIRIDAPPEAKWDPAEKRANPAGLLGGSKVFRINQS